MKKLVLLSGILVSFSVCGMDDADKSKGKPSFSLPLAGLTKATSSDDAAATTPKSKSFIKTTPRERSDSNPGSSPRFLVGRHPSPSTERAMAEYAMKRKGSGSSMEQKPSSSSSNK